MNKIYLIGNLTRDPDLRATQSGISVCNFSIAVNRRVKDAQGRQQTDYFDVTAWRKTGEIAGKFLRKGKKVAVIGEMQSSQYTAQDGSKRVKWSVVADEIEFLSPAGDMPGADAQEEAYLRQEREAIQRESAGFTQVEDNDLPF